MASTLDIPEPQQYQGRSVPKTRLALKRTWVGLLPPLLLVLGMVLPIRLWVSFGPVRTFTVLDVGIWLTAVLVLLISPSHKLYVGTSSMFFLLAIPVGLSAVSLAWSADPLSTVKNTVYVTTALLGYVVVVNVFRHSKARTIINFAGFFAVASILIAILYWSRIPIIWRIFNFSLSSAADAGSYEYAAAFARLDSPYWGRSNDFGTGLAVFAVFFFGIALSTGSKRAMFFFVVTALGIMLTLSRGVILAAAVVILPMLLLQRLTRRKLLQLIALFFASAMIVVVVYFFVQSVDALGIDILSSRLSDPTNITARLDKYAYGFQLLLERPVLGFGGGRYIAADVDSLDSALHNTFLEQWVSYGIPLGTLAVACLVAIPLYLWRTASRYVKPNISKYAALAATTYILISSNQTSNEAVMPRLMFFLFLGFAVAYLKALPPPGLGAATTPITRPITNAP